MNPDIYKFYKKLTWDDLVDWFEDRIVDRGKNIITRAGFRIWQ
jgi:hypothetical protein